MDYQIALLSNGANVHIAQDGVTLCDTKYAPDSFDTIGTLAQAKNAANTMDARRPCEDCIERAHELLDEERDDETTEVEASDIDEAHAEALTERAERDLLAYTGGVDHRSWSPHVVQQGDTVTTTESDEPGKVYGFGRLESGEPCIYILYSTTWTFISYDQLVDITRH